MLRLILAVLESFQLAHGNYDELFEFGVELLLAVRFSRRNFSISQKKAFSHIERAKSIYAKLRDC
jgi:hypothetical protein